jgi:hypothetical protein
MSFDTKALCGANPAPHEEPPLRFAAFSWTQYSPPNVISVITAPRFTELWAFLKIAEASTTTKNSQRMLPYFALKVQQAMRKIRD